MIKLNKLIEMESVLKELPIINEELAEDIKVPFEKAKVSLANPVFNPLLLDDKYFMDNLGLDKRIISEILSYKIFMLDNKLVPLASYNGKGFAGVEIIYQLVSLNTNLVSYLPYVQLTEFEVKQDVLALLGKIGEKGMEDKFRYRFLVRCDLRLEEFKKRNDVPKLVFLNEQRMMQKYVNELFAGL